MADNENKVDPESEEKPDVKSDKSDEKSDKSDLKSDVTSSDRSASASESFHPEIEMDIPKKSVDSASISRSYFVRKTLEEQIHTEQQLYEENKRFLPFEMYCNIFVNNVIDRAIEILRRHVNCYCVMDEREMYKIQQQLCFWPTIKEFTIPLGAEKIVEYVQSTSDVEESWVFSVKYLETYESHVNNVYKYEVAFALPNIYYPIPQVTASLFFYFDVHHKKSHYCHVNVTYQLEGFRSVFIPGVHRITDNLLLRVLDSKLRVVKEVKF